MKHWQLLLLTMSADAYPQLKRASFSGIATFNNYAAQGTTVCGKVAGQAGTYAAAASDLSANISGGKCDGTIDQSKCNGQSPVSGYVPPSCLKTNCGTCYSVTNAGKSIIVEIVDSCPSTNAANFCKTDIPASNRCGAPGVNQLDIDQSAYQALTGQPFGSGGNLQIQIAESSCSGGGTDTAGSDTVGADTAGSGTTPAGASNPVPGAQSADQEPQTNAAAGSGTTPAGASNPVPGAQSANQEPQTNANATSPAELGSQKLGAQKLGEQKLGVSTADPAPLAGSSNPGTEDTSKANAATADQSKANAATADKSKANPATADQSTANPATEDKSTANPATEDQSTANPATADQSTANPATADQSTARCVKAKSKTKKKRSLRLAKGVKRSQQTL